ncbi:hypothetical protein KV205_30720 [Streptomyces sp. SKN60]|uniref:hypothetical protein n=1 Tax=Streptomyces sp. SKN60 TaxID=2855506 RepID=UPI00224659FB|nr:hypothetical protein [Streptomyces sp. SKN60]MCX2184869.1 hypothetical protein [Streptomyces sp. SKN60]
MLTFDDVYRAPLDKMKAAADDWSEMKAKLDRLAEDARTTMAAKAKDDYWRGVNAEVTKPFVDKTAKEFADAAKEADGIHKILQEGYSAFKKAQDDLKRIIDTEAPAQGMVVMADGHVEARDSVTLIKDSEVRNDPDYPDRVRREREAVQAMQLRLDAVVEACDDADESCSNALKANVTGDKHNFSGPKYASLDAEEAQRALALARKGADLSHEELQRLNELLQDNHGSQEFSRKFYDGLGPKGALEFFARLSTDTYGDDFGAGEPDKQRLKDVQALQQNLGFNLATATRGGDQWADRWSTEMRRLGTEYIPLTSYETKPALGYQLLGGIMRYGTYDPRFLVPIAEHVTQLHAKSPNFFSENTGGWIQNPYNPSGTNGSGFDPMTSMLEALGHSPEAAKQFFSADPTSYEVDGGAGGTLDLGKDKDGKAIENYFDFFTNEKYASFQDSTGHVSAEATADYLPDAFGHALEAATTGHAWDDPSPELKRDAQSAAIMREVMTTYGADSGLRERHKALIDSLGNMGAAYIDDLNYSIYNFGETGDSLNRSELFPLSSDKSARTDFGQGVSLKFMAAVAADDGAYRTMSAAQQVFEASGIRALHSNQDNVIAFAENATKVHGLLDESRIIQIADDFKTDEDARNLELEKQAEWRKSAVSGGVAAVVGVGSAVVLGPAAGLVATTVVPIIMESAGATLNTNYATDTLQYLKDNEYKNDDQALDAIYRTQLSGQSSAMVPLLNYAESVDMSVGEKRKLFSGMEDAYNRGVIAVGGSMKVK